ncbi:sialoadhesin-like [Dendropsophus ebraccatus]|uniref:sialoadhesin-like n=1 Tax=Dendropsophus ebraccatus TaxID=150705 RepID=UPI0038313B30
MKRRIYSTWILLVTLSQLWRGITCHPSYSIQVSPSVSVQEGLCVTIPCTFTADGRNTFRDSSGYWRRMTPGPEQIVASKEKSSDAKKNFYLMGNPDTGDCTLTITDAGREDHGTYYFRFEERKDTTVKYSYYKEITTITVTDLTEEPVMSDLGTVTAGIDKTVTCSPPGNCSATSLVIQWKKSDVSGIWKTSPTITFTPSLDDHQKTITCEMTNSKGKTTKKTILLDVCYIQEEPLVSDLGTVTAGIEKTVTCSPSGNCPASSVVIQWKKSDVSGIWKTSPTITFTPSLDDHQKTITCEMRISGGKTTQKSIVLDVCYLAEEPLISDLGTVTAGIDKEVTCSPGNCSTTSFVFQWKKSDVSGIWKNSPTITFTPSPDDHQKNITCEMTNSKGKTTKKTILLNVYAESSSPELGEGDQKVPFLQDPKVITGLITGGSIIILTTLLGIVFLVRRNRKRSEPSEPSALSRESPASMKVEEDDLYVNAMTVGREDETCFTVKSMQEAEDNIYANMALVTLFYMFIVMFMIIFLALNFTQSGTDCGSCTGDLKMRLEGTGSNKAYFAVIVLSQLWMCPRCQDTPEGYSIEVLPSVTVQEGLCVTIPCAFTANYRKTFTNSTGYWKSDYDTNMASSDTSVPVEKENFHLIGNPDNGDCTLKVTDARKQDTGTYFFRFVGNKETDIKYNYLSHKTTLLVTDLTQKPEISNLKNLRVGQKVTLTCTPPGNCDGTRPTITWWKDNVDGTWGKSPSITFTPLLSDDKTSVSCEVNYPAVKSSTQKTVILDVQYPPWIDIYIGSSGTIGNHTVLLNEGDSVTLNCSVTSNPAALLTWTRGENTVVSSVTGQGLELYLTDITSSDINTYSCSAWNPHGDTSDFVDIILRAKNEDSDDKLTLETATAPDVVTSISPQCGPRDVDLAILGAFIAGNLLILSLIALALLCFVRRNMKKRREAIIHNGEELRAQGTATAYKNLNE